MRRALLVLALALCGVSCTRPAVRENKPVCVNVIDPGDGTRHLAGCGVDGDDEDDEEEEGGGGAASGPVR